MGGREPRPLPAGRVRDLSGEADRPILVLGSTGFVGRTAVRHLRELGREVAGTSTSGEGADLACDVREPGSAERAIRESAPGALLLTAGVASVAHSWEDPGAVFRANTAGVFNVLEAVRRHAPGCHVLFASSAAVYGPPGPDQPMPYREAAPVNAVSPYAASKAAAEVLCAQYARETGMPVTVCRIFNQVGPGQNAAQAPAEFSQAIAAAELRGEDGLRLGVGDPAIERDFTDVRDTARAFARLIDTGTTGTFNVCSGHGTSLARIVEVLAANSPLAVEMVTEPDRARRADILSIYGSNERLAEAVGWRPKIGLERSLAELLDDWRTRV